MKKEQLETMQQLARKGQDFGELWDKVLESAFIIHGHVCGGMPLGFRVGLAALKALGTNRELNMSKLALVETGTGHAAGCFADGVQMATGCTFGKGLIQRTEYGKWAVVLVDKATRKAVRVSVRPENLENAFRSEFVKLRHQGVPATEVPIEISRTVASGVLNKPDEELLVVSEVFEHPLPDAPAPSFNLVRCASCGEAVAENKARVKDGKQICLPCSGYAG